ncbi:MAG TPA: helix-turn-helix domain-containing protein [Candidatus Angelobacter sp.]|nr:helix-turn-helix domain-containing protein [Candidatus Angelobacter sp.]
MQKIQFAQKKQRPLITKEVLRPDVHFSECPIKASIGVLGRKWTTLLLRDIGFRKVDRFNHLLESIPGLTPRVLSMRLKELEKDGIIQKTEDKDSVVRWTLTEKGEDTLPILMRLIAFGSKWYAREVFKDKLPRTLNKIFTKPEAQAIVQRLYES